MGLHEQSTYIPQVRKCSRAQKVALVINSVIVINQMLGIWYPQIIIASTISYFNAQKLKYSDFIANGQIDTSGCYTSIHI